jgi:hypothetical protein
MGLTETFGSRSDGEDEEEELARLREFANAAGESFGYQMEALVTGLYPTLGFDRVRYELDLLGFDCTEIHRGIDQDLFAAGVANFCRDDHPTEVIVARFNRRR